jgi:hypothetical protein
MEPTGSADDRSELAERLAEADRSNRKLQRKLVRRNRALAVLGIVVFVLGVLLLAD